MACKLNESSDKFLTKPFSRCLAALFSTPTWTARAETLSPPSHSVSTDAGFAPANQETNLLKYNVWLRSGCLSTQITPLHPPLFACQSEFFIRELGRNKMGENWREKRFETEWLCEFGPDETTAKYVSFNETRICLISLDTSVIKTIVFMSY